MQELMDEVFQRGRDVDDFQTVAARLGLELTWTAMFGKRLGCLADPDELPTRLMNAAETTNCSILETDNTERIWRKWKTAAYKRIEDNLSYIESVIVPALLRKQQEVEESKTSPDWEPIGLLDHYFQIPGVDFKDITGMAVDLILGGIDTTSYTSSFLVWHLTQNPRVQELCRDESRRLLDGGVVRPETLADAAYVRAVLKETFRLNPIAIGISRNLAESTVLAGHLVPKDTLVITQNMVACRQAQHFKNPTSFLPERWVKGSEHYTQVSPYLILPFSHGPRTCIARRLAEQNLLTLMLKMMSRYRLEWRGKKELKIVTPLICKPDSPVKISLHSWDC
ncbi:unnamed protein product [Nesidiocoris tenuis]|uniref:Uncharacterized protein n=1 Tax=Nesidiocoris tenuis TaxID=355587 RepID=A0A6H5HJ17_9HEMI|nr:unnamed protein product [Nesidiocoris tenuis]